MTGTRRPRVAIGVDSPLLADTLGRALARQRGAEATLTSPDVVVAAQVAAGDADYLMQLPGADEGPALLVLPEGERRAVVVDSVEDLAALLATLLRA